jgi:hypothetical protein
MAGVQTGTTERPRVKFHYVKSASYREAACDGAIGGVTPRTKIWIAFFAERYPLPRMVEYEGQPTASSAVRVDETASPVSVETRQGIVRNVEFGTYLDIETARRIHAWLGDRIAQAEKESKS